MLLITVAVILVCFIWIVCDSGFDDVFSVYGTMFQTAWQMRAWSAFASCGWRFLVIVSIILATVAFAYQATFGSSTNASIGTYLLWGMVAALAVGLVPWTIWLRPFHRRRSLNAHARMLSETALHLRTLVDLSSKLHSAGYTTESGWDAWHPSPEWFQSAEGQSMWNRVVPVVYTSTDAPRTVVIPIRWSSFCIWGSPQSFAHPGRLLPVGGPGVTRFRALSPARQLKTLKDCWIVEADIELPDDTNEVALESRVADIP